MYADDIILMASTVNNMQKMLNEVTKFGKSHQIKFNPTKTSLLVYNPKTEDETVSFLLCDQQIIKADSVKYLGNELSSNYTISKHVENRKRSATVSLANLYSTGILNEQMNSETKIKLFNVYLKPLILYGCDITNYSITEIAKMKRIEGNMLKKIIGMAKTCVSEQLYGALNLETVEESILKQ